MELQKIPKCTSVPTDTSTVKIVHRSRHPVAFPSPNQVPTSAPNTPIIISISYLTNTLHINFVLLVHIGGKPAKKLHRDKKFHY